MPESDAEWERLLSAERHLQALLPGAVLVGGTAAALHAGHRVSLDGDHVRSLDGVETGIRQLRRTRALEVEQIEGLTVPTLPEMARIKAWLLATRLTVRDYLDTVVLFERLGPDGVRLALRDMDALYAQPTGASVLVEVAERLASAAPVDVASVDLRTYRAVVPPWDDWAHVTRRGGYWAQVIAALVLEGG